MIVIPMAGLSSRFFKAGYDVPKYQLDLHGETVFSWAISSFRTYFDTDLFVFIYRDIFETEAFLKQEIDKLGIKNYQLVSLGEETLGQADTVYQGILGLKNSSEILDEDLFIFNIDSKLLNFQKPAFIDDCDGYLEVFEGEGDHWSFVELGSNKEVIRTTEKKRISNLCSNGLYYFRSIDRFLALVKQAFLEKYFVNNELYIAPLYNLMIQEGEVIYPKLVDADKILFCGTPDEYSVLLEEAK